MHGSGVSTGTSTTTARRRLLANVVTEKPVGMMAEAAYGPLLGGGGGGGGHPAVVATGAVALWAAVHASEQARAVARALLASAAVSLPPPAYAGAVAGGERGTDRQLSGATHRARCAIALMLQ